MNLNSLILVSQDFPPEHGGIQAWSHEMASSLSESCEVTVVAPRNRKEHQHDMKRRYRTVRTWTPATSLFGASSLGTVSRVARKFNTRVVLHAQYGSAPGSLIALKRGIIDKYYVAAHGREILTDHFGAAERAWRRSILRNAEGVVAVSEFTAGLVRDLGVPEKRIHVVNNGVSHTAFYPIEKSRALREAGLEDLRGRKLLLTIARLVERKGILDVAKAFSGLARKHKDWVYVVVGEGPCEAILKEQYGELLESGRMRLIGKVPFRKLRAFHNVANVFAMPSKEKPAGDVEGFGLVFLEAGACEVPVIGSYSGGIPDAVECGVNGLLSVPGDVADLTKQMDRMMGDRELRIKLGRRGLNRSKQFTWKNAAQKVFEILTSRVAP